MPSPDRPPDRGNSVPPSHTTSPSVPAGPVISVHVPASRCFLSPAVPVRPLSTSPPAPDRTRRSGLEICRRRSRLPYGIRFGASGFTSEVSAPDSHSATSCKVLTFSPPALHLLPVRRPSACRPSFRVHGIGYGGVDAAAPSTVSAVSGLNRNQMNPAHSRERNATTPCTLNFPASCRLTFFSSFGDTGSAVPSPSPLLFLLLIGLCHWIHCFLMLILSGREASPFEMLHLTEILSVLQKPPTM